MVAATQGDRGPATRHRSHDRLETQPGAGSIRFEAHRGEEGEDGARSAPAGSCCPFPGVGNGKHRLPPSPPLPPQGGANKQLPDPNSLFAASVSTRCACRARPEARRRPRYRKFESISLQRRVSSELMEVIDDPPP